MTLTSTTYPYQLSSLELTEKRSYSRQESLAALFFIVGFLMIAFESLFFNRITAFAPTIGLPVFLWPSELWFIVLGCLIFSNHLSANQLRMRIGDGGPILIMALFLCIAFLHGFIKGNPFAGQEFREVAFCAIGLPGILLLAPYFDIRKYTKIALLYVATLSIFGLFFIFQENIINYVSSENRITSNAFSLFLLLILPFAFLSYANHRRGYLTLLVIFGLTILANFNKVTVALFLFAIICSLVMFYYLHPKVRAFNVSKRKIAIVFKVLFIIFAAIVALYSIDRISGGNIQYRIARTFLKERFTSSGELYYGDRTGGRIAIWEASVSLWLQKPLFGHGSGKTVKAYSSGWKEKSQLHNYFFQFLQNTGLFGILLIITCWIVWWRRILPKIKSVVCLQSQLILSAMVVFLFTIMFYGLFGHPLSYPPIANLFWVCTGFLSTITQRKQHLLYN